MAKLYPPNAKAPGKCSKCDKLFSDKGGTKEIKAPVAVAALNHKWDADKVTTEPTVGAEGVKTFTCQNDKTHTRTEAIAKVDKAPVGKLAEQAEAAAKGVAISDDGSDVPIGKQWVTPAAKKALDDAIEAAKKVADDPASTQADIDAAAKAVADAQAAFEAAKKPGTKKDEPKPVANEPWTRLSGDNAFETMATIIDEGKFEKGGTVVLASLEGYWDALTAAGVAGLEKASVIMTLPDGLSEQAVKELKDLAPKKIVVCGGSYWIPDAVVDAAAAAAGTNPEKVRLAGAVAVNTAEEIAAYGKGRWSDTAIIATVGTFQDALASAAFCGKAGSVLPLVNDANRSSIDSFVKPNAKAISHGYVFGGTGSVSPDTMATEAAAK